MSGAIIPYAYAGVFEDAVRAAPCRTLRRQICDNTRRVAAFAKLFRKHTGGVDV
ncbi:hypothetical protein I7J22_03845 [Neisseria meningitidis]|uniref:hypothetical protein n=1 Tax=Neisseria meningitidis TaxID=487 RepID=UPI001863BFBF|nr:hypothetical protein [Neisseria meningitidis]MBH2056677.1 hypothetical protein [Neisseria meningitidis]MBH2060499.1 hypothetical protein [Neisseria meningitidis]MBH2080828.1 hypothetical protein [Neisseria meningitidis]MBH2162157.1 hypothetical protein [Neisseria meningitidis]MBH2280485.1 hypothetical protein [Neisseria meningitidis]